MSFSTLSLHRMLPAWGLLLALGITAVGAEPPSFNQATRPARGRDASGKTLGGKDIATVKAQVEGMWEDIKFVDAEGNPIQYIATIKTTAGDITAEFFPDVAPGHVRSFIALSKAGFYDGLIFHRVIPGFVIQGGCPFGTGMGGPGYEVKAEFNRKPHLTGVLSMARAQDPNSAGSQFFVCVGAAPFLDNNYTVFGTVKAGMDVAQNIAKARRDQGDRPLEPVKIERIVISTK